MTIYHRLLHIFAKESPISNTTWPWAPIEQSRREINDVTVYYIADRGHCSFFILFFAQKPARDVMAHALAPSIPVSFLCHCPPTLKWTFDYFQPVEVSLI